MTYLSEVQADTPLVYYRIDDAGSTTEGAAVDKGSLKLNGKYHGTVPLIEGALVTGGDVDKAGSWSNAIANFISVPDHASLHLTSALTVEAWVYRTSSFGGVFEKTEGGTLDKNYLMFIEGGFVFWRLVKAGVFETITKEITANNWHHIVGTYDGTKMVLYVDGVKQGEKAVASPIDTGTGESFIGKLGSNSIAMVGRIDEVAVYGTALSEARVKAHYEAGTAGTERLAISGSTSINTEGTAELGARAKLKAQSEVSLSANATLIAPGPPPYGGVLYFAGGYFGQEWAALEATETRAISPNTSVSFSSTAALANVNSQPQPKGALTVAFSTKAKLRKLEVVAISGSTTAKFGAATRLGKGGSLEPSWPTSANVTRRATVATITHRQTTATIRGS